MADKSNDSTYDPIAEHYATSVQININDPGSVLAIASSTLLAAATQIPSRVCCDLACGEGHLTTKLAQHAENVIGIDLSERLLALAKQNITGDNITFVRDDVQSLSTQPDERFDLVISNLALMDIPDLRAVYAAVYRVLRPGGHFIYSITHPCFQAPHATTVSNGEDNDPARQITRYTSEGFWQSKYPEGIRSKVGAYHRTLSTIINGLIETNFAMQELIEPTAPPQTEIPSVLVINAQKPDTNTASSDRR